MLTERLVVRISPEIKAALEAESKRTGFPISSIVRDAIASRKVSTELNLGSGEPKKFSKVRFTRTQHSKQGFYYALA